MMKIIQWRTAVTVILILTFLLPAGTHVTGAASKYVELEIQWEDGRSSHDQTLRKEGITYGSIYSLAYGANLQPSMKGDNTLMFSGNQKRIEITMGSRIAEVDGREVDMGTVPVQYISHLYVPIKFLAPALGGEVDSWDKKTGKVTVTGLKSYLDIFYGSSMGYSYVIRTDSEDLEITNVSTKEQVTIPLGIKNIDVNTQDLTINFNRTPKNLLIVTIVHSDRKTGIYDLYTLLFKDQGLIRKAVAHGIMEQQEFILPDGKVQLMDDNHVRILEDGTGSVLEVNPIP